MKILQNQAKCLKCNTSIYSAHRHDYVTCPCGSLSVDGGLDYLKRGFKDKPNYIEESISISADLFEFEIRLDALCGGEDNLFPIEF